MMSDKIASIIRTIVPAVVAFLVAWAARAGLDIPVEEVTGVIEIVVLGVYYAGVRYLEENHPKAGWLLGLPAKPSYQAYDKDVKKQVER